MSRFSLPQNCVLIVACSRKSINVVQNKSFCPDERNERTNEWRREKKIVQWIFQWIRIKSQKIVSWQAGDEGNSPSVLLFYQSQSFFHLLYLLIHYRKKCNAYRQHRLASISFSDFFPRFYLLPKNWLLLLFHFRFHGNFGQVFFSFLSVWKWKTKTFSHSLLRFFDTQTEG